MLLTKKTLKSWGLGGSHPWFCSLSNWGNEEKRHHELPMHEVTKGSGPLILKDTWRAIKSSRHFGYRDFEEQRVAPPLH